jgi:hypothetical protein
MHPTGLFDVLFVGAVVCLPVGGLWLFHALSKLISGEYLKNNSLWLHVASTVVASALLIASMGFLAYTGFLFLRGIYS